MSKYQQLYFNPPKLSIKEDAREVVIKAISAMCDNVKYFHFTKKDGDFKLRTYNASNISLAFSNFQIKSTQHELEWDADDHEWDSVVKAINSGVQQVESVRCR